MLDYLKVGLSLIAFTTALLTTVAFLNTFRPIANLFRKKAVKEAV
ncbi:MAG TPA: hypothetical protein PK466_10835 [Thermotogota bacterium]|nr:hypothetical protein [Thermotogota bacterium]HPJ89629.1 hypothetical protein [Thermotogota bacterium]HPR96820.1 hypothetical protein [Thermotogota bacterium]